MAYTITCTILCHALYYTMRYSIPCTKLYHALYYTTHYTSYEPEALTERANKKSTEKRAARQARHKVMFYCLIIARGPVAQWIRHRPTEPGIAGSSPAGVIPTGCFNYMHDTGIPQNFKVVF